MKLINRLAAAAALTALACTSVTAFADDHGYTEGAVVNVASSSNVSFTSVSTLIHTLATSAVVACFSASSIACAPS